MEGQGEILRIEARPADGKRDITLDPATGLITDQSFQTLPEPYRVARYGCDARNRSRSPSTTAPIRSGRRRFSMCSSANRRRRPFS